MKNPPYIVLGKIFILDDPERHFGKYRLKLREAINTFISCGKCWACGLRHLEIREPGTLLDKGARVWHQDNTGEQFLMALWSNKEPTFFRTKGKPDSIWRAEPNQLVVIDNSRVEHRGPKGYIPSDRVFVRAYPVQFR